MKISTALSFQRSLNTMQETSAQVAKTREQLATGKEIVNACPTDGCHVRIFLFSERQDENV